MIRTRLTAQYPSCCLGSANVTKSPNIGIRSRTHQVRDWQDHSMVVRWIASSLLDMEKCFKRSMGVLRKNPSGVEIR